MSKKGTFTGTARKHKNNAAAADLFIRTLSLSLSLSLIIAFEYIKGNYDISGISREVAFFLFVSSDGKTLSFLDVGRR